MNSQPRIIACPTCGKPVSWTPDNAGRPFCSNRCKMIDLGAWATERYRVPINEETDQLETAAPDDSGERGS
jgi:uncharacterized protein